MEKSEQINELVTGLIGFHKEVGKIIKNVKNPFFKSSYGDLNSYLAEIKEPLVNNGLVVIQLPITNGLTTILSHTSGQYISETMTMQPSKNDPQGQGSALTYMRRYSLASILNLNAEDDDGNEASRKVKKVNRDFTKEFSQCSNMEAVKNLWSSLSATEKTASKGAKDNRKEELS